MKHSILAAALTTALGTSFGAASAQQAPATPAPVIVRAARMLDVTTGTMLRNPVVVVVGDRITAVNPATAPAGASVLDLGDVTLLPGLIDLHTHLASEISATSFIEPVTTTDIDAAYKATKNARTTLMAGFTTVRDFGGEVTVALGRAMEAGTVLAPRIIPSRNLIGITGGHCDVTGFAPGILELGPRDGVVNGPWEAVEAVRYQIKHGAQVIKICATAGVLSLEGPVGAQQLSYEEMKA
ncbi:MAG TPA: amidohydrolase family protein, partial [Gemmatimonadaceae bacterium]|nr:amidohydrolase family protein [Gemmatimonadaceae bacterium]